MIAIIALEVIKMTEKEAIKAIMKERGWSQAKLAKEAGYRNQSNIGMMLSPTRKSSMNTENLISLVTALGCELVIRDKMGTKKEWVIDMNSSLPAVEIPREILERLKGKSEEEKESVLKMLGYKE